MEQYSTPPQTNASHKNTRNEWCHFSVCWTHLPFLIDRVCGWKFSRPDKQWLLNFWWRTLKVWERKSQEIEKIPQCHAMLCSVSYCLFLHEDTCTFNAWEEDEIFSHIRLSETPSAWGWPIVNWVQKNSLLWPGGSIQGNATETSRRLAEGAYPQKGSPLSRSPHVFYSSTVLRKIKLDRHVG